MKNNAVETDKMTVKQFLDYLTDENYKERKAICDELERGE